MYSLFKCENSKNTASILITWLYVMKQYLPMNGIYLFLKYALFSHFGELNFSVVLDDKMNRKTVPENFLRQSKECK